MSVECKTFDSYIKELIYHPRRAPKWLADRRLTNLEKKILQGYLLIRSNKSDLVIKDLKDKTENEIGFVHDHWNLILGICYNNIGEFGNAEIHLNKAVDSFKKNKNNYHLFTALFNYLLLLSNAGRVEEEGPVIEMMEEICPDYQLAKIRLARCQFIYACDVNKDDYARQLILEIEKLKTNMSESDLAQHLICEFMFYIKHEELDAAENVVNELKKCRNYSSSENFKFIRTLLSNLTDDNPVYVYERDFPTLKVLYWQLKVVESLQRMHREDAYDYWDKLAHMFPKLYQSDFKYVGEKNLFSLCLNKHLKLDFDLPKIEAATLHEKALKILQQAKAPIRNEDLYALIYEQNAQTKDDILKLSKLISKVRSDFGVEIAYKKGAYNLTA